MEDDIVLASSSQHNHVTVQNSRGSTTVVIVLVGMNTILLIQVQNSIENEFAMKLSIGSVIDNFASVEKNGRIILS